MKKPQRWFIMERHNPQLGVYYVARGQMSERAAKKWETGIRYGTNSIRGFDTEVEYQKQLEQLKSEGHGIY